MVVWFLKNDLHVCIKAFWSTKLFNNIGTEHMQNLYEHWIYLSKKQLWIFELWYGI